MNFRKSSNRNLESYKNLENQAEKSKFIQIQSQNRAESTRAHCGQIQLQHSRGDFPHIVQPQRFHLRRVHMPWLQRISFQESRG